MKLTDNDDVDVLPEINSGCVVLLSENTDILVEKVHPMERRVLLLPNYTSQLLPDETKMISKISNTNDDYLMIRHDCESAFYDITSHTIPLVDLHHDSGIDHGLVFVRRSTFGREPVIGQVAKPMRPVLGYSGEVQMMSLSGIFHRHTKGRTISIYRHGCWDPGGQKMETIKNIGIAKRVDASCNIHFPIFVSNFTVYVWNPGGWMMKIDSTKRSQFLAIDNDNTNTIFRLHSSVYVWDLGGLYIDLLYSVQEYYILRKGPAEIVYFRAGQAPSTPSEKE
jgi:hypothetical protein